jgi:hypothetical protein
MVGAWLAGGLLVLALALPARAVEVPFASPQTIGDEQMTAAHADVDRDGDLDAVGIDLATEDLAWFENTGSGWTSHPIATSMVSDAIAAADVDGDGDVDVVTRDTPDLVWYENTSGNGSAWSSAQTIASSVILRNLEVADLDRDGDADVVVAANTSGISWYEKTGSGWTPHSVETGNARGSAVGDLDGDGDLDLLAAFTSTNNRVSWYENTDGAGSFGTQQLIIAGVNALEVVAGDLDGDGDLDVAAGYSSSSLSWFENVAGDASAWSSAQSVGNALGPPLGLQAADLDADGDLDIVSSTDIGGAIRWHENTAGDASAWTSRTLDTLTAFEGTWDLNVVDVDGDGDLDVAVAGPDFSWYPNQTIHRSAAFPAASTIDAAADFPYWVSAADLDRDGDQDALIVNAPVTGGAGIRWRENTDGAGSFGPASLIASAYVARVIRVGDLDRDGDPDLVTASNPGATRLSWHENTAGDASSWTTQFISSTYPSPSCADVGDIDRDGDLDVIAGSSAIEGSSLAWFENTAGDASAWSRQAISAVQYYPTDVRLADVDGDGDLDAFYNEVGFATIAWKENTAGDGSAWSDHIIENGMSTTVPNTVEPVDVDGDGDVDVVVASRGSNNSAWFENANGAGTSWTRHSLTSPARLYWLRASDLDRDGDIDVVGSGELEDRISVFENLNGDGTSWDHTWTPEWLDQPLGLDAADLDGDGDDDLLAVGFESHEVISVMNGGGQFALRTTGKNYQGMVDGRKLDVLLIDATHRGRAGDSDAEIADFALRFEDESGAPLSSAQANALLSQVRFYLDDGNRTFEEGVDTPLLTAGPLTLDAGVEHFTPADGDANHQLVAGTSRAYHVVATLQPTASAASPKRFQVVHLTESGSQAEDRSNDLPVSLEAFPDTGSEVIEALPATGDADADGLTNVDEADAHASDPLDVDTDGDGLEDGDEVNTHGTSPINNDSDDDGLGDGLELSAYGTSPLDPDSDDDGYCDGPFAPIACTPGDNCPAVSNGAQTNGDAFAAGDACQCGDVSGDGPISPIDYTRARELVVGRTPGGVADPDRCDVTGDGLCGVEDLALLDRLVSGSSGAGIVYGCDAYRGL